MFDKLNVFCIELKSKKGLDVVEDEKLKPVDEKFKEVDENGNALVFSVPFFICSNFFSSFFIKLDPPEPKLNEIFFDSSVALVSSFFSIEFFVSGIDDVVEVEEVVVAVVAPNLKIDS